MKILDYIEKIAKEISLDVQRKSDSVISVWTSPFLGISLIINSDDDENLSFYYSQRTTSWVYNGERTDLHDIIPIVFALYIKKIGLCSLYFTDVFNPATEADDEIYSKYLIPFQINNVFLDKSNEEYYKYIDLLIYSLFFFEQRFWDNFPGCPCKNCRDRLGYEFEYNWEISNEKIDHVLLSLNSSGELINYCERTLPNWFHFRDFKKRITIIQSNDLYGFIYDLIDENKNYINSISGKLFTGEKFSHYISNTKLREIKNVFKKLEIQNLKISFLENRIIGIGKEYIISFNYDCSIQKFQIEKGKLKLRHDKEFQFLFKPSKLEWLEKIDDSRFEDLIKDLLEREPDVTRVRKIAHTRERDGGVDLIVDWKVPKTKMYSNDTEPYYILKIIVQCKAYKEGVSKSKVTDIRDTIEYRNYDGYFLAVSSYIRKSLSDYLDKLRTEKKFWIEWWSRDEIEKRLINHKDLILKYSDIIKIKE
ncbi:MAG: restriction endonuclease [Flavobacteriaceae bacterium]